MWTIKISKSTLKGIFLPVMFFLIIFNPPFLPVLSFTIIFTLIALIYCAVYNRNAISMVRNQQVKHWLKIFVVFYAYYFLVSCLSMIVGSWPTNPVVVFIGSIVDVVSLLFMTLFLCLSVYRTGGEFEDLTDLIISAGVIESVFGIAAFLSPTIKEILNNITIANSNSDVVVSATVNASFRNYGIASTLFDSFGFGMSIIALLALHKGMAGRVKHFVYFAMIAFAACINARTSMVLITSGSVIIVFAKSSRTMKAIIGKSLIIFGAIVVMIMVNAYLKGEQANAQWLVSGIDDIKALLTGQEKTGIFLILSKELYIPQDIMQIIFGTGLIPAQAILKTTDIGYIQNLWSFGVIGSLMLYAFFAYGLLKWARIIKKERPLSLAVLAVTFLFFMKLNLWGYGISTVVYMTLLMGRLSKMPQENGAVEVLCGENGMLSVHEI